MQVDEPRYRVEYRNGRVTTTHDGCSGAGAAFVLSAAGGFLRTSWEPRALGCAPTLPSWPGLDARRVGLEGDVLVLYSADATELARMVREDRAGGSVRDRAQGRWASTGSGDADGPLTGLWLEVDGDVLTHAENASCNTDPTGYTLSAVGAVVDTVDAWSLLEEGTVNCQPGFAPLVPGRVGSVVLQSGELVLLDDSGSEIARFEREQP